MHFRPALSVQFGSAVGRRRIAMNLPRYFAVLLLVLVAFCSLGSANPLRPKIKRQTLKFTRVVSRAINQALTTIFGR
ncbi:hypothetical protein pipiens_003475 [Culex pipiens pipiens]|uniref:Uncharacterized protein n=1 Tax=Culex pipiens pipiens TaxID=38569 RepID=A0ABD1CXX5_CULPP